MSLIPILIAPLGYAALLKYVAKFFAQYDVSWLHGLVFAVILAIGIVLVNVTALTFEFTVSLLWHIAFSLIEALVVGGWFLSTRATTGNGMTLGWQGAMQVSGMSWLAFVGICFILQGIAHFIQL